MALKAAHRILAFVCWNVALLVAFVYATVATGPARLVFLAAAGFSLWRALAWIWAERSQ